MWCLGIEAAPKFQNRRTRARFQCYMQALHCFIRASDRMFKPRLNRGTTSILVKEGGLHYFSTTRAVGQTLRAGHSLLYPCFYNISPSLLGALPSYETGGSVAFVCNGASSRSRVAMRLRELSRYRIGIVAFRPLLSVYSIRGFEHEPLLQQFDLVQGLWGITTLCHSV